MIRASVLLAALCLALPAVAQPPSRWLMYSKNDETGIHQCRIQRDTCTVLDEAPPDNSWHLLTQANNGIVSLISGLTKDACEDARKKLDPFYQYGCYTSVNPCAGVTFSSSPGDIKMSECFQ